MNGGDFTALLPLVVVGLTSVVVMLLIAAGAGRRGATLIAFAGEIAALFSIPVASRYAPRQVTPLLAIDSYALFLSALFVISSAAVLLLSYEYLEKRGDEGKGEFSLMLLLATLGSMVLVSSNHFASFLLGLEILSVSLYVLISYPVKEKRALEAGLKYLILAGASSAILLFGMALVYAQLGTMEFSRIAGAIGSGPLLLPGFALILSGVSFKLALVPFHMWTPDVYEGAPAPATAFVATVSKGAMFGLLLRYFMEANAYSHPAILGILYALSIASMIAGNYLALIQANIKRILAYSSIAHLGYLLVALLAGRSLAVPAATFYLVTYFVSVLTSFGIVSVLSAGERDADSLEEYRGLFWRRPWLAAILTAALFSLAGVPLTAGFVGKFFLLRAGVGAALWLLVLVLALTSVVGLFYYLRIIVALYSPVTAEAGEAAVHFKASTSWLGGLVLSGLMMFLVWLGIFPSPVLRFIQQTVVNLI